MALKLLAFIFLSHSQKMPRLRAGDGLEWVLRVRREGSGWRHAREREIEEALSSGMPENATAFGANAGIIDLLAFILVWVGGAAFTPSVDDCF